MSAVGKPLAPPTWAAEICRIQQKRIVFFLVCSPGLDSYILAHRRMTATIENPAVVSSKPQEDGRARHVHDVFRPRQPLANIDQFRNRKDSPRLHMTRCGC